MGVGAASAEDRDMGHLPDFARPGGGPAVSLQYARPRGPGGSAAARHGVNGMNACALVNDRAS